MKRGYNNSANTASDATRLRKKIVSLFGLALLGLNVLTAALFVPSAPQPTTAAFTQGLSDGRIVICTAGGMLVLDKDGQPVSDQNGMNGGVSCVFCLPLMHGGIDAPVLSQAVLDAPLAKEPELPSRPVDILSIRHFWLSGASSPRAPPIV